MDEATLAALRTGYGQQVLAAAREHDDPVRAAAALRSAGFPPALAAAALTQVELRARAAAKFGPDAQRMMFTRAGLEQATRAPVAARRAARLAAAGVRSVADLGCGIGADALAFGRAGLRVRAVESDPLTAALAAANAQALGLADRIAVACGDASAADLSGVDAVFCDPARREGGRRVFDPAAFTPPWTFVTGLAERVARTVLKLAPGLDHALIPPGAEAEWVSVAGDVVEATLWHGPLATVPRRATVLRGGREYSLTGTGTAAAPVAGRRRYLTDPDGAVIRAGLVAELAATVDGTLLDPRIAYIGSDAPIGAEFGHCFEVTETVPFALKRLRAALRERGIGRLEIRKRGVAVDPDRLRRELRLTGDASATLVLTRIGDTPTALLCVAC